MLRNKFANKFTQISNAVLNDNELTLEEKGLFCYLFSKPDGWEFHYSVMRKELNEKSDKTIRKVLNRLAEKGYITKRQINNPNGQFGGMDIEFTDKAFSIAEGKNTDAANLPVGKNAESVNLPPNNTNNINNTDVNTNTDDNIIRSVVLFPTKKVAFIKPNIKEIEMFCSTEGINVDAKQFYYFYESKGWMVGKNKMKNWKAALRTWERKAKSNNTANEFLRLGQEG